MKGVVGKKEKGREGGIGREEYREKLMEARREDEREGKEKKMKGEKVEREIWGRMRRGVRNWVKGKDDEREKKGKGNDEERERETEKENE